MRNPGSTRQKFAAWPVSVRDESDWDGSAVYVAWVADGDKLALDRVVAALIAANFALNVEVGADGQVDPNHVSRPPTRLATIINRIVAPWLDSTWPPDLEDLTAAVAICGLTIRDGKVR